MKIGINPRRPMEMPQNFDCLYHGLEDSQTADRLRLDGWCVVTCYGQSMTPILESGQSALVEAVSADTELNKDDIVFCNVDGYYYLHKIWAIEVPDSFMIGNNHGKCNGTIGRDGIYGIVRKIMK